MQLPEIAIRRSNLATILRDLGDLPAADADAHLVALLPLVEPLRRALTGRDAGPEMADVMPLQILTGLV